MLHALDGIDGEMTYLIGESFSARVDKFDVVKMR